MSVKVDRVHLQVKDKFWDVEDQDQPAAREGIPRGTPSFEVEGPVDTEGVIRRIDRHLLPLLFSLALLCSIDRGMHTAPPATVQGAERSPVELAWTEISVPTCFRLIQILCHRFGCEASLVLWSPHKWQSCRVLPVSQL